MSSSQLPPLVHRQLVPADSITANYDNEAGILILQASGQHVDFTRDIKFHRLPFAGGLLFELQGLVGPIIQGESPYDITDGFNIELPNITDPSNTVVVNTANKKGWVVPIQYNKSSATQPKSTTNGKTNSDVPEFKTVAGDHTIVVPLDKPYTIKQGDSFKGKGGAINLAFDDQYSNLTDASIEDGKIEWTLVPFQTGQTEVAVFVGQTDPPFFYRVNYNVEIVSPKDSVTSKAVAIVPVSADKSNGYSTNGSNGSQQVPKTDGLPLSWDDFVNIGYNLIKKQYPDAALYEIDATPVTRKPVSNEWGLVNNRIVCGLDGKTAIIQSTGWGEFGPVQVIDSPWLGDVVINWPVSLEIHDAFSILRKGGYKQPVEAVTLRQPLYPGDDQPFYIFSIGNEFIAVGVNDKKIQNFGVSEHKIQKA